MVMFWSRVASSYLSSWIVFCSMAMSSSERATSEDALFIAAPDGKFIYFYSIFDMK